MTTLLRSVSDLYGRALSPAVVHRGELLSVQRLRGLAVFMVLIVHALDVAHKLPGWEQAGRLYIDRLGYSAPDMFFVISGFIMSYITFTTRFEPRRWLISRFFRIFPLYMFFTGLLVMLWLYNPSMTMGSGEHDWGSVTQSLLMLPQERLPLLFVGWTVEHELVFYATVFLVARFLGSRWLLAVMLGLSALALGKWCLQAWGGVSFWDFHVLSLYMLQFTMGALVYRHWEWLRRFGQWRPLALAAVLVVLGMLFAESGEINQENPIRVLAFGGAYSLLLLTLLNREKVQREAGRQWTQRDIMVRMGDASYSIYLTHPFVLGVFGTLYLYLMPSASTAWMLVVASFLATLAVGMAAHVLLEKPIIEIGKRLSKA
ncbi:acyltransferase family protein [Pseudomonas sp. Gutcm_11s]|uniref:acyltransferase family protein n=1 Tax=Pseudomonas sp. Gutcm_11s TaxID=3026088 RepID=UPI0023615CE5|nr:acyltransferase [Pseudomonas sp. Gutcm_11s]MDD0841197.1 acyltransferase [Pseudomonas sp. Gutcm_11s]